MITLYGFRPLWGLPDLSPFVTKVDGYLRLAGLPYRLESYPFFGLGTAPKGKLPFIEDRGQRISDSSSIIEHLTRTYAVDLDGHLSVADRATAHAVRRMIEENLYWVLVQQRWRIDENWEFFMSELFGDWRADRQLQTVLLQVRHGVLDQMRGHGIGRHSIEEVWQIGMKDIEALAAILGDRPFFGGERPGSLDTSAYAFLAHLQAGYESPAAARINAQGNLTAYCARMENRLFGAGEDVASGASKGEPRSVAA